MKIFNIGIAIICYTSALMAVPQMPQGPVPVKPIAATPTPVAQKPVAPTPVKSIKPQPPVMTAKAVSPVPVAPVPVVPKVITPVPVAPKMVAPALAKTAVVAPTVPVVKPFVQPEALASQVVGVITVKNRSKYQASWTGWKTKYKTQDGKIHYKLHTLKTPHELQPIVKGKSAQTLQGYTVHNLPPQSFVEGVSHLMINGQSVLIEYQGSAWMPGVTDAIYITSGNGTTWTLDKKAMDKDYKKINSGVATSKKIKIVDDSSISKVTDTTKAASVPMVLKDKKNQKKFKNIKRYGKPSKSSQAFEHATDAKAV